MNTKYFVGTSGWHYEHWKDRFYPRGLSKSRWLEYYAQSFGTVEINNTFYRLPSENAFRRWYEQSPGGFVFVAKASRIITHYRKLRDVQEPLDTFVGRARLLQEKLGPILYQLPPSLRRDDALLESFVALLPTDLRHAVEFRHSSWYEEPVFDILRRHGVACCVVSRPSFESPFRMTARFAYIRFHGSVAMYSGSYSDEELNLWAKKIRAEAAEAEEVFAFFNNDAEANAVHNALDLIKKLR